MKLSNIRLEVMATIEKSMDEIFEKYLKPIEVNWQPSDLLPVSSGPEFIEEIKEIQGLAREMSYDLWVILVGDTITEEALPSYESWLMEVEGVDQDKRNGWSRWIRAWTAEENRHGDLLNKYLYLSGMVDMREMEITTQWLINDGFDIGTGMDPYRNFVYTSFQEKATNISHRRVATMCKQQGNNQLAKICGVIASDEARHANAYQNFVKRIFEFDPSEMMLAFEDMMRKKIVMPAHLMRESGGKIAELFDHFSDAAQRMNVYTTQDYIDILKELLDVWELDKVADLNDKAEKARDYLMKLPGRLERISERITVPTKEYQFKWVGVPQGAL
ncbi:MAG: acyl-ACP desaturase [Bacteroidia bacterium]|nr:acyl-ACP desaturase [Bacteroidia bacterium]NNC85995.1 acyl-ACP desaturase [Bacteroidia bacterium]NNM16020.1 acyl-ACP desaturase [Bacteroidia bacterium]